MPVEEATTASLRRWSVAVALLAALQLLLGAVIRHTGAGVDWHVAGAVMLTLAVAGVIARVWRARRTLPAISVHAVRLGMLLAAQLLLGVAVFTHRGSVALRTAHVATGALLLAQAVVLAWEALRRARGCDENRALKPSHATVAPARGRLRDYLELTKPRLSSLVLLTTAVGYWLGRRGSRSSMEFLAALLGTASVVAGANALNEWMERDADALMHRTKHRPLPAGRLRAEQAWWCGAGLIAVGLLVLAVAVNGLSALLAAIAAATYLFLYTPLKRHSSLCTLVGAIPGALPPMIGWAAARHTLGVEAWVLFAMLYLWQLPHFLAIATLYRDDYARAGFRMLPVIESDGLITARQTALAGLALVPVTLCPPLIGLGGPHYFYSALLLGVVLLGLIGRAAWTRSRPAAQQLFVASVLYLPALLGVLAYDHRG
jgi:protoheme IX farnesyltransferase